MRWRVVTAAAEFVPLVQVGGLGPVATAMARGLARAGHDVTVVLPAYRGLIEDARAERLPIGPLAVPWNGSVRRQTLWRVPDRELRIWLLEDRELFDRPGVYVNPETGEGWPDDADRWGAFCRGIVEALLAADLRPDLLHGHDYQAALLPLLARARSPYFAGTASVLTIHNAAYQGIAPPEFLDRSGLGRAGFHPGGPLEYWGQVNLLKAGVLAADRITTVSPRYAVEISTSHEFGAGLEGVFAARRGALTGILNGIDVATWNPADDPHLAATYDGTSLAARAKNRRALLGELGLADDPKRTVLAMVTRLAEQKGIDLVLAAADAILARNTALVVLGSGRPEYERGLADLAARHGGRVAAITEFNDPLAHRIYAGADLFLMPSRFEPCGLGQMVAMRYGALPLARRTGGLADTIVPLADDPERGTGFLFGEATPEALVAALDAALELRARPKAWTAAMRRAMARDAGWGPSLRALEGVCADAIAVRRAGESG